MLAGESLGQGLYSFTDLGTFGGAYSEAVGINSQGQIIGSAVTSSGQWHAFLYSNGQMADIGPGGVTSSALGINDQGQVVGLVTSAQGLTENFVYQNGSATLLAFTGPVRAINNRGDILANTFVPTTAAYLVSGNGLLALGPPGTISSTGNALNNSSHVAGQAGSPGTAFFFDGNTSTQPAGLNPTGGQTVPLGLNDHDEIVGYRTVPGSPSPTSMDAIFHAFDYRDGQMSDLGTLGGATSQAYAINNQGQIVGASEVNALGTEHGFVYENGSLFDLNNLVAGANGWVIERADAINDGGEIVGYATQGGVLHAFLLTPIPEPGIPTLAGVAAVVFVLRVNGSGRRGWRIRGAQCSSRLLRSLARRSRKSRTGDGL
jgi:probable HAF family extracellular repeat protein